MEKKNILFIFGTRPEAIKMAPLIQIFNRSPKFNTIICVTAQHREMLDQVTEFFDIKPHYDLNLMQPNQSLFDITTKGLKLLESILENSHPDLIFVQGDTTSSFIGALAGYYKRIRVGHIEAGLRSHNKYSPYPEEINRVLVNHIADYHFAPTLKTKQNLLEEGIKENIWVVGNTVIDALFLALSKLDGNTKFEKGFQSTISLNISKAKIILVTGHRRESFGEPFEHICYALKELAIKNEDIDIIYPVHYNPNVRIPVNNILSDIKNIHLINPLDYPHLIWLMNKSYLILIEKH